MNPAGTEGLAGRVLDCLTSRPGVDLHSGQIAKLLGEDPQKVAKICAYLVLQESVPVIRVSRGVYTTGHQAHDVVLRVQQTAADLDLVDPAKLTVEDLGKVLDALAVLTTSMVRLSDAAAAATGQMTSSAPSLSLPAGLSRG